MSYQAIALSFARLLIDNEYSRARAMLSLALQRQLADSDLKANVDQMIAYSGLTINGAEVSLDAEMTKWPDQKPGDVGWAYVSISKSTADGSFAEAITVTIDQHDQITNVGWGRP